MFKFTEVLTKVRKVTKLYSVNLPTPGIFLNGYAQAPKHTILIV